MIYATDLDHTLIYSRSAFKLEGKEEPDVRLIETLNGEHISFITERAVDLLEDIARRMTFVPVTTRTIEQYSRITLFQTDIVPKYAVVSNGGHILQEGAADADWHGHVLARIDRECAAWDDVSAEFRRVSDASWVLRGREADGLFYYFIVDVERIPSGVLEEFGAWLDRQGWGMSLQGKKLYFVPKACNKKDAVLHIMEREGDERLAASGDSLLDLSFLEIAEVAIAPAHGEIYDLYGGAGASWSSDGGASIHLPERDAHHVDSHRALPREKRALRFTASSGIAASEQILTIVKSLV